MVIVFPEFDHPTIQAAIAAYNANYAPITAVAAANLETACAMLTAGQADAMIAGIEYDSRAVILACKDQLGLSGKTFSGLAVMERQGQVILLADMAACKHPSSEQLTEIITQTVASATKLLSDTPRIALLSFSTAGSGGHDGTIDTLLQAKQALSHQGYLIDGEMQLDAALNPTIGQKKFPDSAVAGHANVLIAPDLNSGNLLYKAFEQLGGYRVAGPILQGFNYLVSDLSRGSTVDDVFLTIAALARLAA